MDPLLFLWQLGLVVALLLIPISLYKLGVSKRSTKEKTIWCLIILVFPIIGSLAYLLVGAKMVKKGL